jgi:putative SOS response-associated peptidase YedK
MLLRKVGDFQSVRTCGCERLVRVPWWIAAAEKEILQAYAAELKESELYKPNYNIAPTDESLTMRNNISYDKKRAVRDNAEQRSCRELSKGLHRESEATV